MGAPTFHSGSRVSLYPLTVRQEDGDFIVGRIETGTFVSLPEVGVRALEILREGETLHEAEAQLATEDGSTVDLQAFAAELLNLGFIATVDGDPAGSPTAARNHLSWLQPMHVRWLFSRPAAAAFFIILAAATVTLILHPDLLPVYNDYFWSPLPSLVIAGNLVLGTFHLVIHEFAHLVAARAEGIPALIRWGTRLQYFVVQTDVSGAWALPRFARYRIYLAGILWDLLAVSLLILASAYAGLRATGQALLAAWILLIFFGLVYQFSFYMRTDIYFVLLDLLHSRNLFQDAQRLLRHQYRRGLHRLLPNRGPLPPDPLLTLSASERRKVAFYAGLLITGTTISLGCYLFFGISILLQMVSQAAGGLVTGLQTRDAARLLDSGLALLAIVGTHALFVAAFFHSHRGAIASVFATMARTITPHPALPSGPSQSEAPPPAVAP